MLGKQILVAIAASLAATIVFFAWAGPLQPAIQLPADDTAARLAFAAKWLLFPGFALLAGIIGLASRRFFYSDAIDGTRTPENKSLEINLRYNQNTLEQTLLVVIAWPLMALWLPQGQLGLIPVLAVLFVFGRAAFWIGYLIAPVGRAFGFALTFYPTVAAYIWLAVRTLR